MTTTTSWFNSKETIIDSLLSNWDEDTFNITELQKSSLQELQNLYQTLIEE
jgi:hypothetical protein